MPLTVVLIVLLLALYLHLAERIRQQEATIRSLQRRQLLRTGNAELRRGGGLGSAE